MAERAGVCAVVRMLGEGQTVINAIARGLNRPTARVRRSIALVARRARHSAAAWERRIEQAVLQSALQQLTGGARLAVILAGGAGRALPRACPRSATVPRLCNTATAQSAASVGRMGQNGPVIRHWQQKRPMHVLPAFPERAVRGPCARRGTFHLFWLTPTP